MKLFISWAGPRSKKMAKCLRFWLPEIFPALQPWVSFEDAKAGEELLDQVNAELKQSQFGIFCLTVENLNSSWMHYEACALAFKLEKSRACPYILDFDIKRSVQLPMPLSQFAAVMTDREGTLQLVKAINLAFKDARKPYLDDDTLETIFREKWPKLNRCLRRIDPPRKSVTYDQLIKDFHNTGEALEKHRSLLHSLIRIPSLIKKVIDEYDNGRYPFDEIVDLVHAIIQKSREPAHESLILGDTWKFYEENYSIDHLRKFIRDELQPILKRSDLSADEREQRMLKRIESEEIAVFAGFHQILASKLVNFPIS